MQVTTGHNFLWLFFLSPFRPSSSSVQVLQRSGHCPVTGLAWSPDGRTLLSSSPVDTSMLAWCVAAETCTPLWRFGGGGVALLSWAPDGSKVFAATPSNMFRYSGEVHFENSYSWLSATVWDLTLISYKFRAWSNTYMYYNSLFCVFRVWETKNWSCEKWNSSTGFCKVCMNDSSIPIYFCVFS